MKLRALHTVFLTLALPLAACSYWVDKGGTPAVPASNGTTAKSVAAEQPISLRLRGSSTIGSALAPRLVAAFLAQQGETDVVVHEEQRAQSTVTVTGSKNRQQTLVQIAYPGSSTAFTCLEEASCDIGLSSRAIHPDEAERLKSLGDMTAPSNEHVIALDGIAIVVNQANKLSHLTVAQIAAIFQGETGNWSKLGGASANINVYTRDHLSGTYDSFSDLALHGKAVAVPGAQVMPDNSAVAAAVAHDPAGIGFVGNSYVAETKALAIQEGSAAPLAPTLLNISTEDYPFARRLYFYTPEQATPLAEQFMDFVLSDKGQAVVEMSHLVSLDVRTGDSDLRPDAPPAYTKLVNGGQRLSFNFRFRSNSNALDGRAQRDVERLARFLQASAHRTDTVTLIGFTDNLGNDGRNLELSNERASSVAQRLREKGVTVNEIGGLGDALPVASNDTSEGRNRNRRVEVWLRKRSGT